MTYHAETIDLPYLGESLETMLRCEACGYRHVDFVLTQHNDPLRHSYLIEKEDDMMVRVVRSASGTIRIPELGIDIEPGMASEAFITNIEGILMRIEKVLSQLHHDAESDEVRTKVETLQQTLLDMRTGKAAPATLVLEDPFGNSGIISDATEVHVIPEDEAAKLKVGMFVIDRNEGEEGTAGA